MKDFLLTLSFRAFSKEALLKEFSEKLEKGGNVPLLLRDKEGEYFKFTLTRFDLKSRELNSIYLDYCESEFEIEDFTHYAVLEDFNYNALHKDGIGASKTHPTFAQPVSILPHDAKVKYFDDMDAFTKDKFKDCCCCDQSLTKKP